MCSIEEILRKRGYAAAVTELQQQSQIIAAIRAKFWRAWYDMIRRCTDPNRPDYRHYGGRGITVCARWLNSFEAFVDDMGPRPSPKHSLDRIDNNGSYCPENCKWATKKEQRANQRVHQYRNQHGDCDGVTFRQQKRSWQAQIWLSGKHVYLGLFSEKEHAMAAYRIAAAVRIQPKETTP